MAGVFYTLQEVLAKLGKTEADIKSFVREGKLREFRDGTKQLYKTEDVDALAAVPKGESVLSDSLQLSIDEKADVSLAPEEIDTLMGKDEKKGESKFKLDETGELVADESLDKPNKDETTLAPAETKKGDLDLSELEKTGTSLPKKSSSTAGASDILAGTKTGDSKISLSGESINVLGESDTDFKISEDTSGETKVISKGAKPLDEKGKGDVSSARLDDDVNLEGIGGSGSGLLDLSLQADDTSLGAVLDDIYPESPAAAPVAEPPKAAEPTGSVAQEADKIFESGGRPAIEQPVAVDAASIAYMNQEVVDKSSGLYAIILFLPLAALIYTAIMVISGYKPILNLMFLSSIEPIIWYIVAGLGIGAIVVGLLGLAIGGGSGPKTPKPPKPPKEKKVKKDKKEKEAPAKEG